METSDRASIISEYMREIGRRGGNKNKEKGREYFSKLGKIGKRGKAKPKIIPLQHS